VTAARGGGFHSRDVTRKQGLLRDFESSTSGGQLGEGADTVRAMSTASRNARAASSSCFAMGRQLPELYSDVAMPTTGAGYWRVFAARDPFTSAERRWNSDHANRDARGASWPMRMLARLRWPSPANRSKRR
jgi:hypothetical protein